MRRLIGLAVLALVALSVHSGSVLAESSTTVGQTTTNSTSTTVQTPATTVNVYPSTTDGRTAVCAAYCDVFGYYVSRRICVSITGRKVYCCGDVKYRYCCTDVKKKLQTDYPDVKSCPNSAWWLFHWRIIVGLLGTVMVIMMCGACVYYCCIGLCRKNERVQAVRRRFITGSVDHTNANASSEPRPAEQQPMGFTFDPSNPNAFVPPPYDSLPKDPPKYADLFNQGQDNQAFQGEASTAQGAEAAAATTVVAGAAVTAAAALSTSGNETTASGRSAASGATGTTSTSAAAPASPNRTTVVTPPAATTMTDRAMAEVAADCPPPYSRTDPNHVAPPRMAPMNQAAAGATAAPPSVEAVQRIEVGAATAARSDSNTNTSPV